MTTLTVAYISLLAKNHSQSIGCHSKTHDNESTPPTASFTWFTLDGAKNKTHHRYCRACAGPKIDEQTIALGAYWKSIENPAEDTKEAK